MTYKYPVDTIDTRISVDPAVGEPTMSRGFIVNSNIATGNSNLRLTYFTAKKSLTITQIRTMNGTAAVGTTLARIGVYSVDGSGNLTLIGSTANDTTLWNTANTAYTKSFSASFVIARGSRYAVAPIVVGTSTAPTMYGNAAMLASEGGIAPQLGGLVGGQSDLPSTVTAGSVGAAVQLSYHVLLP
jgi:hypothetical protein